MGQMKFEILNKELDKELLRENLRIISWLDRKRWCKENQKKEEKRVFKSIDKNLSNSEKILVHWLCYITDRQMRAMRIWDLGGAVFSDWVRNYCEQKISAKELIEKCFKEYDKNKGKFKTFNSELEFSSRFPRVDKEHIFQTLKILESFEVELAGKKFTRNLVAFILHFIKDKEDCLRKVACALYLLTYKLDDGKKANPQEILEILNDNNKFSKEVQKFKKKATEGKKRLWAALRDYKKGLFAEIFKKAIREIIPNRAENFIKTWEDLPLDLLELPGDRWNSDSRFIRCVLGLEKSTKETINLEKLNVSELIREIYKNEEYHKEFKKIGFYPEQFDVSFDFARKMCEERLCHICLFNSRAKSICVPNKEYCTVALITCGYLAPCDQENCIINKTKKLL